MAVAHVSKLRLVTALLWLLVLGLDTPFCSGDKVDEYLKRLNKPPLKSILSPDGDTIDCVHISQQPAFDNPSLKAHAIRMMPSYTPKGLFDEKNVPIKQTWHSSGMCPEETIPIRRTKREDILRSLTIESFGKKQHKSLNLNAPDNRSQHEHAIGRVQGGKYYGTVASVELWAPKVMLPQEFSLSQLWVIAGLSSSDINTIEVGWQIYPNLYGDYKPRLFIYWTSDDYKRTGCYNLMCSGFVQINNKIAIGGAVGPVSSYNGAQYEFTMIVWKDQKQGVWWLQLGNYVIGYWPAKLFSHLKTYAEVVDWGGEVVNVASGGRHTTTQMGSGHFPTEGFGKASFFRNIYTVDAAYKLKLPLNMQGITDTSRSCYDVKIGTKPVAGWGSYFYYGGPGRNSACP